MTDPGSPAEARRTIDDIDEELVRLLARRERLARTRLGAAAPQEVIERVRNLALVHGLDPQIAEETWRSMLAGQDRLELREQAGS